MSIITLVHPTGTRVSAPGGNIIPFEPLVPRNVHSDIAPYCLQAGCFPPDGIKDTKAKVEDTVEIDDAPLDPLFVAAVVEVLAQGDATLLTASGTPRVAAIKNLYSGEVTTADIERAMADIASAEQGDD